jgi:NitT/TauT family transport system substrate-binding protein
MLRKRIGIGFVLVASLAMAACGSSTSSSGSESSIATTIASPTAAPVTLRLGYFPNITHATALVGVERGIFADKLGLNVTLKTATFNAGGEAIEALFADAIDATYIGPNPAINGFAKSGGKALRIISGATSGGAYLVVRPEITSPAGLKGAKLASPQLGGTQDVALRAWLKSQGLAADTSGGGDVSIVPQENGATLDAFKSKAIDGAWLPEPWATRLMLEGGGKVLVDEKDLWPAGQYVTTHLIVSTKFLDAHPDVVKRLIEGQVAANEFVNAKPADAQEAANAQIEKVTQKRIADTTITAAWKNLTFTNDPIASSLKKSAESAQAIGLLKPVDLAGIYDLKLLNDVLTSAGLPAAAEG